MMYEETRLKEIEEDLSRMTAALQAQQAVRKLELKAIAKALRAVLDVGAEEYPCEYSKMVADKAIDSLEEESK